MVLKSEAQVLPDSWSYQSLGKCLKILTSGSRPKGGARQINEGIPSIGGEHINWDGTFKLDNIKYIPDEYFRSMKRGIIEKNDILLAKDGVTIGKLALAEKLSFKEAAVNEHVFLLKTKDNISKNYLFQYLISPLAQHQIRGVMSGSAQPGINSSIVDSVTVPVPPLVEQRGIAEVLGTVDEAIRRTDAVIEKTEELKRGLMQRLLTRGIGHTEFKDTELGEIPLSWKVKTLEDVAKIERGRFSVRPRNDPMYYGGNIAFIQTGDIAEADGIIKKYSQTLNENGLKVSKLFKKGTIVVSIAANIGDVGMLNFDSCFPDSIVGITPNDSMNKLFLMYLMRSYKTRLNKEATISTQKNINLKILAPLTIQVPPIQEQNEIEKRLSEIECKLNLEKEIKVSYINMKKSLMQELLSGQVRVELREDGLHRIGDG